MKKEVSLLKMYLRYVQGVHDCVEKMEVAEYCGALMSKQEKFDYYFKRVLDNEKVDSALDFVGYSEYRRAYVMAMSVGDIIDMRSNYSLSKIKSFINNVRIKCDMYGILTKDVKFNIYEKNLCVYICLTGKNGEVDRLVVYDKDSLVWSLVAVVSFLCTVSLNKNSYRGYVEAYLPRVFNSLMNGVDATIYYHNAESLLLKNVVNQRANRYASKDRKVINFKVG